MASVKATPITFVVSGVVQTHAMPAAMRSGAPTPLPAGLVRGSVKQSVRVGAQQKRALHGADEHELVSRTDVDVCGRGHADSCGNERIQVM